MIVERVKSSTLANILSLCETTLSRVPSLSCLTLSICLPSAPPAYPSSHTISYKQASTYCVHCPSSSLRLALCASYSCLKQWWFSPWHQKKQGSLFILLQLPLCSKSRVDLSQYWWVNRALFASFILLSYEALPSFLSVWCVSRLATCLGLYPIYILLAPRGSASPALHLISFTNSLFVWYILLLVRCIRMHQFVLLFHFRILRTLN